MTWQTTADALVRDLRGTFADRLECVVAYGPRLEGHSDAPLTCLALVTSLTMPDLEGCARHAQKWKRAGIAIPLIVPHDEFRRSLDAFPLEYSEIIRTHARVYGDDPFTAVEIARDDLRRACETQIKSHLLHLREGFIEADGRPAGVAELVAASVPAFAALLRNVARLDGVDISDRVETTRHGARRAGLPEAVVGGVLALEEPSALPTTDAARLFPAYLAAVEHLAHAIDTWTS